MTHRRSPDSEVGDTVLRRSGSAALGDLDPASHALHFLKGGNTGESFLHSVEVHFTETALKSERPEFCRCNFAGDQITHLLTDRQNFVDR